MSKRKVFIQTLGCQMNVRDSEHMIAELEQKQGYSLTPVMEDADLILINTCSVRDKPVRRLFSEVGNFQKRKKKNAKIGVCGCTASHLGEKIIERAPYVDFVLGARNISKISEAVEKAENNETMVAVDIDNDESLYEFKDYQGSSYSSSINISIGCDKKCTFCIVPYTRGEEISVPSELIVNEVKRASERGAKEIFLLGQNVNNYGKTFSDKREKTNFTKLLQEISQVEGIERIRFTSPHPLHMDDEFIEEFARNDKICKNIHMPLQSGSTNLLKSMKRGYTKEWFLNRANKIRQMVPNVTISTDIIVGFPGETDEDFLDTLDVVEKIQFEQVFNFKYSPREHTKAKEFTNQVDDIIASERLIELIELHKIHKNEALERQVGTTHKVLLEDIKETSFAGRSDNNFPIRIPIDSSPALKVGDIVEVTIVKKDKANLIGIYNA